MKDSLITFGLVTSLCFAGMFLWTALESTKVLPPVFMLIVIAWLFVAIAGLAAWITYSTKPKDRT